MNAPQDGMPDRARTARSDQLAWFAAMRPGRAFGSSLSPLRLPAEPASSPLVRYVIRRWLSTLAWPAEQIVDIVLAVDEAVSEAIERACSSSGANNVMDVLGRVWIAPVGGARRVELIVSDGGRWRLGAPGFAAYGLRLMRGCMDRVEVQYLSRGCRVTLVSRAVAISR